MLYIDPSETRSTSKLEKLLANPGIMDMPSQLLPGLEAKTGADVMNSPLNGPTPNNDFLLQKHINAGASLIQIKFDHDLISSILDGRFKEAQWRMLNIGAYHRQCVLLFIGFMSLNGEGELLINNRRPVDVIGGKAKHFNDMKIMHYHKSLWQSRGDRDWETNEQ